jgi:hypothetical protein
VEAGEAELAAGVEAKQAAEDSGAAEAAEAENSN